MGGTNIMNKETVDMDMVWTDQPGCAGWGIGENKAE